MIWVGNWEIDQLRNCRLWDLYADLYHQSSSFGKGVGQGVQKGRRVSPGERDRSVNINY